MSLLGHNPATRVMSSKICQTALFYLEGFKTLSPEAFLSVLAPTAIHTFAPSSISPPPPKTPKAFASHIENLQEVLASFPVHAKEVFENEEKRQVTIWATSQANFKDEAKDDGLTAEEWTYKGEYIFILEMDESREKIVKILEFLDSKGTERLRELMTRARDNLRKTSSTVDSRP